MRGSDSGPYAPPGVKSGEVTGSISATFMTRP
jgi:hypothetical protein